MIASTELKAAATINGVSPFEANIFFSDYIIDIISTLFDLQAYIKADFPVAS